MKERIAPERFALGGLVRACFFLASVVGCGGSNGATETGGTGTDSGGAGGEGAATTDAGATSVPPEGGAGGASNIDPCSSCSDAHRACDSESSVAECTECLPGFFEKGGDCLCPEGQVPYENQCVTCAGGFTPRCDATGETGAIARRQDASCICETTPGYFYSLETNQAEPCDADADGWINDSAQPALDGSDTVLRDNARCDVRRVKQVTLQNDSGDVTRAAPSGTFAKAGLPLFESARDDGAVAATRHPLYGAQALDPRVLNGFTKACVSKNGDYNDNGVPDVSEWTGKALAGRVTRNAALQSYYREYLRFSYYLELHDGWFVEPAEYRIMERSRGADAKSSVPVKYPEGATPHWAQCTRHIDRDYVDSPESRAGGDFSEFGETWGGMTQTSQYKCVEVVAPSDYPQSADREANPELVYQSTAPAGLARRAQGGGTLGGCPSPNVPSDIEVYEWTPNLCSASTSVRPSASDGENNAAFAVIDCEALATGASATPLEPGVYWVSVGYQNAACDSAVGATAEGYVRGCINECAERGVQSCENFDDSVDPSSERYTCDDENGRAFGALECGCGRHYAGARCEIGCPGDDLLISDEFSIETRAGEWLCGAAVASSGSQSSAGYSLHGYIPLAPAWASLTSADGTLRLEAR